ncbi:MAG: 50S ribosomal protein L21 [Candidatus Gracilibacteria bacterium]|nr:50S ribosomal protein L21 [Candidatus Gracilibacteria bacterium]
MIAVAKIGGHQCLVSKGETLEVDKLSEEEGKTVQFETLLVSEEDGTNFKVGEPILNDVVVEAKILEHGRGDKVRVYKMKPRKRYRRTLGHRQDFTVIEITDIKTRQKPADKKAETKTPAKKTAAKPKTASPKKTTPKKTTAKKPAAKKTTAKKVEKTAKKS